MTDVDKTGDVLDVQCVEREGYGKNLCDHFKIIPRNRETDHDMFRGYVVLQKPLDYRERQIYRLPITGEISSYSTFTEFSSQKIIEVLLKK